MLDQADRSQCLNNQLVGAGRPRDGHEGLEGQPRQHGTHCTNRPIVFGSETVWRPKSDLSINMNLCPSLQLQAIPAAKA